ncbi:MAG: hypothetical protein Q7U30_01185 [Methylicorpusculum sp.]|nr:hypothetical protein [Methylicorpusculum sp.]
MFQNKEKIMNSTIMPRVIIGLTALLLSSTVFAEAKSFTVKPYEAPAKPAVEAAAPETDEAPAASDEATKESESEADSE